MDILALGVGKSNPRRPPVKELGPLLPPAASPLQRYGGKPRSQAKDTRTPRDRHPTELPPRYSNFNPSHMVAKAAAVKLLVRTCRLKLRLTIGPQLQGY